MQQPEALDLFPQLLIRCAGALRMSVITVMQKEGASLPRAAYGETASAGPIAGPAAGLL